MANAISVQAIMQLTVTETIGATDASLTPGQPVVHNALNFSAGPLKSTSTAWPNSQTASGSVTISGGVGSIDLTNLPGTNGGTAVNGTGLKVRHIIMACPASNAAGVVLAPGASNAYNLFGATFKKTIGIKETHQSDLENNAPTIGAGAKSLALTGTNGDVFNYTLTVG